MRAGVSTDYYTRLEQGRRITPSASVLDAISRALELDDTARVHLGHLVGTPLLPRASPATGQRIRPGIQQLLALLDDTPAVVVGRRADVLATNRLARVLFTDFDSMRPGERNYARWMFLDTWAQELIVDWELHARSVVESLRLELGGARNDPATMDLIEELATTSAEFRTWWSEHRVHQRAYGSKRLRHPIAGEMVVDYEVFQVPGDSHQTVVTFTTRAGTASREAMNVLARWASSTMSESDSAER